MSDDDSTLGRRAMLAGVASGAATSLAGCSLLQSAPDGDTAAVDADRAKELAERFAPTLYFDQRERWFPTDPRPYESESDGDTIVDGFDALNGYVEDGGRDDPPEPRAFYNVLQYEDSSLAVVQFWFYSVFDQFTTNFHWHDWELLQVFVDTDDDDPQLYVASSHSRKVPNNEYLDPDVDGRPRVLSELGSHSSGLSTNADEERFRRLPTNDDLADITNTAVDTVEELAAIPLAYGLPRDEGLTLPYAIPELDDEPLYEHDRLPAVAESNLVPGELTVRSFDALRSPPTNLPSRKSGLQFEFEGRDGVDADETYDLVSSSELEHIVDFAGPQLSFEFAIPGFVEDQFAGHITTTGVPWDDPRYEAPASDITETNHRQTLADRYDVISDPAPVNQVLARVSNTVASEDAPEDEGLTTEAATVESFALLQSDPEAVPTFQGVAAVQDVPDGEHTFTVNGAGVAPHSETVSTADDDGPTVAGVDGEIPLVAKENATKLELDPEDADSDLSDLAVEDDFAGRLYDAPVDGPDAVYVHRGGAFTTEVRDTDDEVGAFRVNPDPDDDSAVRVENPRTGKTPLARYLADVAEETRAQVAAIEDESGDDDDDDDNGNGGGGRENSIQGLTQALAAVAEAADRAAERAAAGDAENADKKLEVVRMRLSNVTERLDEARDSLPDDLARATDRRLEQSRKRSKQAKEAEKL
jgi:hypothetical protein